MVIKHKKGKFNNRWFVDLLLILKFKCYRLFKSKQIAVRTKFTKDSIYYQTPNNQLDWRKLFGSKSGIKTLTNNEEIAVYRCLHNPTRFQVAKYIRKANKGFKVEDIQEVPLNKEAIVIIGLPERFPVTPWAGGNEIPWNSYMFNLKVNKL